LVLDPSILLILKKKKKKIFKSFDMIKGDHLEINKLKLKKKYQKRKKCHPVLWLILNYNSSNFSQSEKPHNILSLQNSAAIHEQ